ncbi:uncharacterized protein SAPINGB_P001348 [Magnusiomyces paraingens]|uniref:Major facilitator superfamily (MFS) profile domain-containing protein n=1 Tax=Magnusiomyces paraingens TaxID=2606893 RepID=A0A5E8B7E8_9ASCO|nr:uncharacterized protein SAPINGB_P001348 [Saprochaete ingens]VVT46710.1 unnamed protein product [Saprochaete ingens]
MNTSESDNSKVSPIKDSSEKDLVEISSNSMSFNEVKSKRNSEEIPSEVKKDCESDSDVSLQPGVQMVELLRHAWPKKLLYIAYGSIVLSSLIVNFSKYASGTYTPFVTSDFNTHSLLSTAGVLERIASIVSYPIVAKTSDFFGRADGFSLAFTIIIVSYIMYASCQNIYTYVAASVFDSIGDVSYAIMVQIFISDTSSFANRGFLLSLPEAITTIPTLYLGSIVAESMLDHSTWRWGYGMWAPIIFFIALPLIGIQWYLQRKATQSGVEKKKIRIFQNFKQGDSIWKKIYRVLWIELDLGGALLLIGALSLILVPITLTGKSYSYRWHDASFIAMFVVGFVLLGAFLYWDTRIAEKPFIPYRMIKHWTVIAALLMNAFDFCAYAIYTSFFPSFLLVGAGYSAGQSTRVDNSLRVSFQISSVVIGLFMKYFQRSKIFVLIGVPLCILGQGLMIYLTNINGTHVGSEVAFVTAKVLYGIGRGFYQTSLQVSVQSVVTKQDVAVVTALFFAAMSLGGAIGVSIGGGFWNNYLPERLVEFLPEEAQKNATSIFKSITVARATKGEIREAVNTAYRLTLQKLAIMGTCFLIPLLLLMFFIKNTHLNTSEEEINSEEEEKERVKNHVITHHEQTSPEEGPVIKSSIIIQEKI